MIEEEFTLVDWREGVVVVGIGVVVEVGIGVVVEVGIGVVVEVGIGVGIISLLGIVGPLVLWRWWRRGPSWACLKSLDRKK
jgi:hypothetical protein